MEKHTTTSPDTRLFSGIKAAEIEKVVKASKPALHRFKRGDTIWREGDVIDGIGLLESGTLLCQRYHPDGKVQLVRLYVQGDIVNVEAAVSLKRTSPYYITAASAGTYIRFSVSGLLRNPSIRPDTIRIMQANLLAYLADDTIRFMKKTDILSRRTVRDRVVMFLNVLRELHGDVVDIGMSQEELAQYLCVDRSSLSEELNRMRREGLIDFHRKQFRLNFKDSPDGFSSR